MANSPSVVKVLLLVARDRALLDPRAGFTAAQQGENGAQRWAQDVATFIRLSLGASSPTPPEEG